jgi:hypothetical protein
MTERTYKLPKQSVEWALFAIILGVGIPVSVLTYLEGVGLPLAVGVVVLFFMSTLVMRHTRPEVVKLLVNDDGIKLVGVDRDYLVTWAAVEWINLRSRTLGPAIEIRLKTDVTWDWPDEWRSNSIQRAVTQSSVFIPRLASESDERDFYQYVNDRIKSKPASDV